MNLRPATLKTLAWTSLLIGAFAIFWFIQRPGLCKERVLPSREKHYNRLIHEKSPYLLQHADNPVDWYPWGDAALAKAREENKPIFLSIGYSTCHWCHVMEKESYEDPEVGKLMNDAFVSIKVDREERPDLDNYYMKAALLLNGNGGWPLNVILTPDKKPFFAGTYFPRESRFGQIGMLELIPKIKKFWETKHGDVVKSANQITAALLNPPVRPGQGDLTQSALRAAAEQLALEFDKKNAGFGRDLKFPTPTRLTFLLRYWKRTGDKNALAMVQTTLEAMRRGGMCDQIGFGFHRYSTDPQWLLPHFEKMLVDQALLAMAYLQAFQATGKQTYADTAREIFTYVLRDMTSPLGGFYSAQDADSEGVEGRYYLWTFEEIKKILGDDEGSFIAKVFGVNKGGNFYDRSTGRKSADNVLHLVQPLAKLSSRLSIPIGKLSKRIEADREKLFLARGKRVHPATDDKILTDWNGLMIAALALGAQVLHEPRYGEAAQRTSAFVLGRMRNRQGRLLHRYRDGEAAIPAQLDDYAFLDWGLINLYEATFQVKYLKLALGLNIEMLKQFRDEKDGGLFYTAIDNSDVPVRQKTIEEAATPSGNSVAMLNLLELSRMTGNPSLEKKAVKLQRVFAGEVGRAPSEYPGFLSAVDFALGPSYEVVIAGDPKAPDTQAMVAALSQKFIPNKVVLLRPNNREAVELIHLAEFAKQETSLGGKATAYVCLNFACKQPTTDLHKMIQFLDKKL